MIWAGKRDSHVAFSQSCSVTECLFPIIGTAAIRDDIQQQANESSLNDVKNDSPFVMDVILIQFDILEE